MILLDLVPTRTGARSGTPFVFSKILGRGVWTVDERSARRTALCTNPGALLASLTGHKHPQNGVFRVGKHSTIICILSSVIHCQ